MATINLNALIKKLNPTCARSLESAAGLCVSRSHYNVEIEHWLMKLLEAQDNDFALIVQHYELDKQRLLSGLNKSLAQLKTGNAQAPALSYRIIELCKEALMIASLEFGQEQIRSAYLFYALLRDEQLYRIVMSLSDEFAKISADSLKMQLAEIITQSHETISTPIENKSASHFNSKTPGLDQFTINLTEQARLGKIDEVTGRANEINQMIDILMRRRQNNPILTGEPGVGKTAVVEGLALLIARKAVPPALINAEIHTLDLGLLQAGAGVKGEFENRLKAVIHEVRAATYPIILFIDEAHTLIGAGAQSGQGDAANLLKPALARGELKTIAATTWAEYKKYFEKDAALVRRFQVVKIEEPSVNVAINMCRGLVKNLEAHHQVRILDEAIIAAVNLSSRYLTERQLPDKAISVLDTACSRLALRASNSPATLENCQRAIHHIDEEIHLLEREQLTGANHESRLLALQSEREIWSEDLNEIAEQFQQEKMMIADIQTMRDRIEQGKLMPEEMIIQKATLTQLQLDLNHLQGEAPLLHHALNAQCVAEVIADWTGIPLGRMLRNEIKNVLSLHESLQQRILGQTSALQMVSQHIHTASAKLGDPRKPLGVFLFVGPSGVGKTETALALADELYGGTQNMTTINLSEFKEEHKVSLLLGSPPGYVGYGEGGVLTEAVRRKPYSLILLDEVEKAHAGVQDIFYQLFDKGLLKDGQGRDVDFKNTLIILTSNVGSDLISKLCSDPETQPDQEAMVNLLQPELQKHFKAAFLGRVTIIPYLAINDESMREIIKLQLNRIQQRIYEQYQTYLYYDEQLLTYLINKCQFKETGARNVEHVITHGILPELSNRFLTMIAENKHISAIHITVTDTDSLDYQSVYESANHN